MMKYISRNDAFELLKKYNKDPFHIQHALTVEGTMRYFADQLGFGDESDFWATVGLLHDLDFEIYPDEHCSKTQEILKPLHFHIGTRSLTPASRVPTADYSACCGGRGQGPAAVIAVGPAPNKPSGGPP